MAMESNLGEQIERKSAEISAWPAWAEAFRPGGCAMDSVIHPAEGGEWPASAGIQTDQLGEKRGDSVAASRDYIV